MTTKLTFEEEITFEEVDDQLLIILGELNEHEEYRLQVGRARALEIAQVLTNWANKQQTTQDNVIL
jgi:hypothetical protein